MVVMEVTVVEVQVLPMEMLVPMGKLILVVVEVEVGSTVVVPEVLVAQV
jgi:hypothetical protein